MRDRLSERVSLAIIGLHSSHSFSGYHHVEVSPIQGNVGVHGNLADDGSRSDCPR